MEIIRRGISNTRNIMKDKNIIIVPIYWSLFDARHCAKRFRWINSFKTTRDRERLETLSHLLSVLQLKSGRNRSIPGALA